MGAVVRYTVPDHDLLMVSKDNVEETNLDDWCDEEDEEDYEEDEDEDDEEDECPQPITETPADTISTDAPAATSSATAPESTPPEAASAATETVEEVVRAPAEPIPTLREVIRARFDIDIPVAALMRWIIAKWIRIGQTKVAVKVNSIDQYHEVKRSLKAAGVPHYEIRDAGRTQVAAGSATVLAVGPFPADIIDEVCGKLKLL
jgi:peptidyl-tRNA hydrolase